MSARLLQRVLRQSDRGGLEAILREHGSRIRTIGRDDEAEVGPLLADAGTDAGGEKTFRKLHDRVKECGRLARGRSAVPPPAPLTNSSHTPSSDSIPTSPSPNHP